MIGSASHVARPGLLTAWRQSQSPVVSCTARWLRGETVQDFSFFFSYKTKKKNKKQRRLGKDLGQRALKANISAEKQTLT